MENNLDPLEEYFSSLKVERTYLVQCPNCGVYSSGEFCSEECNA